MAKVKQKANGNGAGRTKAGGKALQIPSVWELPDKDVEREYRRMRRGSPIDNYTREDARFWMAQEWIMEHLAIQEAVVRVAGHEVPIPVHWCQPLETGDGDCLVVDEVARAIMPGFRELQEKRLPVMEGE